MGAFRNQALACVALIWASCASPADRNDLRTNSDLYAATGYVARVGVDRAAFVAPMIDERQPVAEATSGPFPTAHLGEAVWSRPILTMIDEIVADELRDCRVFTKTNRTIPSPDSVIVTPYLRVAKCGEEEQPTGRRTLADVELRVVVHGPGDNANARQVLLDRSFRETTTSPVEMAPPPPTRLLGVALHKAVEKMLQVLDQSNVSRSGVPMDPAITGK